MAPKKKATKTTKAKKTSAEESEAIWTAEVVVAELRKLATKKTLDGMTRFGIPNDKAFGVSVGDMKKLAKQIGRDNDLAEDLWKTGWYEARMMAAFLGDPAAVDSAQMERWCKDFDSWAICDTVCFAFFAKSPIAWKKVDPWSKRKDEFAKRAAFALLASLTLHDKQADDGRFAEALTLVERAADDERNFVKKGVSWALRTIGKRSLSLHGVALATAHRLAASEQASARWIGKDAISDLAKGPRATRR